MKIKLLLIFLFLVVTIFSPLTAHGTAMEVTVTINSFTVPERSLIDFEIDRPNTEYKTNSARISIVDKNNNFIITKAFNDGDANTPLGFYKDAHVTTTFPYNVNQAPYNVYAEIRATKYPGTLCKANCVEVTADTGWYMLPSFSYYNAIANHNGGIGWIASNCSPYVASTCGSNIAVSPTYVVPEYNGPNNAISNYYFRFPTIYTIN